MGKLLRELYGILRTFYHRLQFYYSINWIKTLYFNFKKFPFSIAVKLPVFFYGKVKFTSIVGKVEIEGTIKRGMIGFGQAYEMSTIHKGTAEIIIAGKIIFKGHAQFGKDYLIFIGDNGYCELGNMAGLGSSGKIICIEKIVLGTYARLGSESQIIDTNFHQMYDTITQERFKMTAPISIGDYNYIGSRVSIMQNTITPNYCTIASNSLCNKDYSLLGNNIVIGGIPAKLIKTNISRDWDGESEMLKSLII